MALIPVTILGLFVFPVILLDAVLLLTLFLGLGMILASRLGRGYRRGTVHNTITIVNIREARGEDHENGPSRQG